MYFGLITSLVPQSVLADILWIASCWSPVIWQIGIPNDKATSKPIFRALRPSLPSLKEGSLNCLQIYDLFSCKRLILGQLLSMSMFDCLVGHDDLGSIDRKGKSLSHWAMESSGSCNKFVDESGISKGKYNLASGSLRYLE